MSSLSREEARVLVSEVATQQGYIAVEDEEEPQSASPEVWSRASAASRSVRIQPGAATRT